ncbi:FGGY family carbohydrate kinase, partial [Rhizobium ruizarguesonis]
MGLDSGNTALKAVIFDRVGNKIAAASAEGHSRMPSPGHVEQGLDKVLANARQVIRAFLEKARIQPEEIAA